MLRSDLLPLEAVEMLSSVARIVWYASLGKMESQLHRATAAEEVPPKRPVQTVSPLSRHHAVPYKTDDLTFFNGFGGFDLARNEYVIVHRGDQPLPAPWINVIANQRFGMHCGAEGGGYSWIGNSRESQITAWSNDPVQDRPSEIFYVRDALSGALSSPSVQPLGPRDGQFITRHGFGYSGSRGERKTASLSNSSRQCQFPIR